MLFHVTSKETGQKIWETNTINPDPETINNRTRRAEMHTRIDKIGNKQHNDWLTSSSA